jgi:hypothetical protein
MTSAPANLNESDAQGSAIAPPPDDMEDRPAEMARWPRLAPVLADLKNVAETYQSADRIARKSQLWHSRVVVFAAMLGAAAVLAALWQLAGNAEGQWGAFWEFIFAVGSALAVALGIIAACHQKWIRERFRAEQCRFIKFDYLLHPQRWHGADQDAKHESLQRPLTILEEAKSRHWLHKWIRREVEVFDDVAPGSSHLPAETADELVSYYSANRLDYQLRYFERQAGVRERKEFSWILPPLLFGISVGIVCVHFALEMLHGSKAVEASQKASAPAPSESTSKTAHESSDSIASHTDSHFDLGRLLVVLAIALPIVGAAIRTYRTAHEFGRNANRFHAVANELRAFRAALSRAKEFPEKLRVMEDVETALKNEHRAWVRLMIEAEWFG